MDTKTNAGVDQDRAGALTNGAVERVIELLLRADPHADHSRADLAPSRLRIFQIKFLLRLRISQSKSLFGEPVVQEQSNGCGLRHEIMQQAEPLCCQIGTELSNAGEIPARPVEARN